MLPMHGSLAADWVDGRSLYGEHDYDSRRGHYSGIPLETQQILENAFTANPYPSPREVNLIAARTQSSPETIRVWFNGQAYRLSENPDPINTATSLHPPGPVSVQSDIQYTSGWIDNQPDPVSESGFHNYPSIGSSTHPYLDPTDPAASTSPLNLATDPSIDAFSKQLESAPPWFPGYRNTQPDDLVVPIYNLTTDCESSRSLNEHEESSYNVGERSNPDAAVESLRPGSVASEAKSSSRSHRRQTSASLQDGVTICNQCGAQFTGSYQRGNWARHVRRKHTKNAAYLSLDCICRVCDQQFNRQDARRKHEWQKHHLPDAKPLPRQQAASRQGKSSHAGTYETGSNHETLTCTNALPEESIVNLDYRVPMQPHRAHNVFVVVQEGLGKDNYDNYCRVLLAQCERIAEELQYQQPDLCNAFGQELRDLSMQLLPEQQTLSSADEEHLAELQGYTHLHYNDTSGNGRSAAGKAPAGKRMSKASSRSHPYSGRPIKKFAPDLSSSASHFEWNEAEMLKEAAGDALLFRASELYAQFSALEYTEAAHERINVEDIKARILNRLEVLRIEYWTRHSHANQPDQEHVMDQSLLSPLALHPAPAPIIGGACDFSTPSYQSHPFASNAQVFSSDEDTYPSSQEHQTGDTSPGFQSFQASSQTSFNFNNPTHKDQSQFAGAQLSTDCSPASHTHGQWFSPHDTNLYVPGSSRLPQQLLAEQNASAQIFPELDLPMVSSSSELPYALPHAPEDDLIWPEATI